MDSQKLLLLSDTHGDVPALDVVLKWVQNNYTVNAVVFLGDGIQDLYRTAAARGFPCEWKIVRGNNDYEHSIPEAAVFDCGDKRFFLCHGHRYALYNSYQTLIAAAGKMKADAALFGHVHIPIIENIGGITLINPGSIGRPRNIEIGATFAIIECLPDTPLKAEFFGVDAKREIRELKVAF